MIQHLQPGKTRGHGFAFGLHLDTLWSTQAGNNSINISLPRLMKWAWLCENEWIDIAPFPSHTRSIRNHDPVNVSKLSGFEAINQAGNVERGICLVPNQAGIRQETVISSTFFPLFGRNRHIDCPSMLHTHETRNHDPRNDSLSSYNPQIIVDLAERIGWSWFDFACIKHLIH